MDWAESYGPPYEPLQSHLEFQKGKIWQNNTERSLATNNDKIGSPLFQKNRLASFQRVRANVPAEVRDLI